MKLPISKRLLCCASLLPPNARLADVGCDHGYLGIYALQNQLANYVAACDLRPGPLEAAKRNAALYGTKEQMAFYLSDGLANVPPDCFDTVVCAGMGGELMGRIVAQAPYLRSPDYALILQPQVDADLLRQVLAKYGFREEAARLVEDGGFLYCVLRVRYEAPYILSPGQCFVSPHLQDSPYFEEYVRRIKITLEKRIHGILQGKKSDDLRLSYYQKALEELS